MLSFWSGSAWLSWVDLGCLAVMASRITRKQEGTISKAYRSATWGVCLARVARPLPLWSLLKPSSVVSSLTYVFSQFQVAWHLVYRHRDQCCHHGKEEHDKDCSEHEAHWLHHRISANLLNVDDHKLVDDEGEQRHVVENQGVVRQEQSKNARLEKKDKQRELNLNKFADNSESLWAKFFKVN